MSKIIIAILILLLVSRGLFKRFGPKTKTQERAQRRKVRNLKPWQRKLFTVYVFAKLNTRRFFRDRLAIFFVVIFPLIFLFVFGSLSRGNNVSFRVALLNQSSTEFATKFSDQLKSNKLFKVDESVTTMDQAKDKMVKSQLDGTIVLPPDFGKVGPEGYPTGHTTVIYTQNSDQAGQTLVSVLQGEFNEINAKIVTIKQPFTVEGKTLNENSLSAFDYTFAGLVGFSIMGLGIFGPINVFPELKKQGILRRFHTTPLRVWQYFTSTMISQAVIGLVAIAIMFAVAVSPIFNLTVVGNYLEIAIFLVFGIVLILGIGLSIGGWAKNERQAAPLGNIIVFPMMFLSGVFFPRFLMPEWLQSITNYIPLTPVIDGLRLMITEGKHLTDLGPQLLVMAVWTVVIYIIAFRVFRWE
ncbi:MAG TPA: ABC transporter permease [Candidatus Binatia bacterium]|nr:ABC transporter permease [Candidatus Binatia bacterium]